MRLEKQEIEPVEYFFSFISLWSYVGSLEFQKLVQRQQLRVVYKPFDLLAIFSAGGGKPVKERAPQRQAYRIVEMQRWKEIRQIPLVIHPKYYPADPSLAHRVLIAALENNLDVASFVHAALKAVWADELDIADPATIAKLAAQNGLDAKPLLARAEADDMKRREAGFTQEAIGRQVFGAPFYTYKGEVFWGQDRLDMLAGMIDSGRDPITLPNSASL